MEYLDLNSKLYHKFFKPKSLQFIHYILYIILFTIISSPFNMEILSELLNIYEDL